MAKENNKNKTINFAEKKKAYASKKAQNKSPQTMPEGKMVYDINRMREQINQQTRNLKNKRTISWKNTKIIAGSFLNWLGIRINFY